MSSGFLRRAIRGQFKKSDAGTHDFWDISGHSLFLELIVFWYPKNTGLWFGT